MTVLLYWLAVVPPLYSYCNQKKYVESCSDGFSGCIQTNCIFVLVAVIGYVGVYRLVMWVYSQLKALDKKMWKKINSPDPDRDSRKSRKIAYPMDGVDSVEFVGIKGKKPYPHSENNEELLVGIHVKKETKLASSANSGIHHVEIHPSTPIPDKPKSAPVLWACSICTMK